VREPKPKLSTLPEILEEIQAVYRRHTESQANQNEKKREQIEDEARDYYKRGKL
jgi:hypothetical protein